jgi:hypothetical protein
MHNTILRSVPVLLSFVVVIAAAGSRLYAAEDSKGYYVYGVGPQRCEDYVKFREKKAAPLEQQNERYTKDEMYEMADKAVEYWIAGFLSAYNLYAADTFKVTGDANMDDLEARLENICRSNVKQHFAEAMFTLVQQLNPQSVKAQSGK